MINTASYRKQAENGLDRHMQIYHDNKLSNTFFMIFIVLASIMLAVDVSFLFDIFLNQYRNSVDGSYGFVEILQTLSKVLLPFILAISLYLFEQHFIGNKYPILTKIFHIIFNLIIALSFIFVILVLWGIGQLFSQGISGSVLNMTSKTANSINELFGVDVFQFLPLIVSMALALLISKIFTMLAKNRIADITFLKVEIIRQSILDIDELEQIRTAMTQLDALEQNQVLQGMLQSEIEQAWHDGFNATRQESFNQRYKYDEDGNVANLDELCNAFLSDVKKSSAQSQKNSSKLNLTMQ